MSRPSLADPPEPAPGRKLYSVPRRYDLATLFTVSFAYALLFAVMRLFSASVAVVGFVALFVTTVGLAQALALKGKSPRLASIWTGLLWALAGVTIEMAREDFHPVMFCTLLSAGIVGVAAGYLAGLLVAGVFLVADLVRGAIRFLRSRRRTCDDSEDASKDKSPFA